MEPRLGRILIRATNWVGDAVMSVPALQTIRERFPSSHITVLARPWVADIYARESFADDVVLYHAAKGWHDLGGKLRLAKDLRTRRFDTAILLQNAFEAALLVWLARIPRRIGYDRDGRGWLLTDAIPVPEPGSIPAHQRFYYLELLRRAGLIDSLPESPMIRLGGAAAAAQAGRARFSAANWTEVTGVSPGAAYGTAKRWLPERFAEAASAIGSPVALFGSAGERALCAEIEAMLSDRGIPARNFAGETSLREFIELAAACRVFLSNDSGAMHIASALGIPTIAIFGATDHVATGPTGPLAHIIREPVECSPCLLRECPIDHRCMTAVPSSLVAAEAIRLIRE
jgi:heptosyltransferase-2